jgi:hypothetical protein
MMPGGRRSEVRGPSALLAGLVLLLCAACQTVPRPADVQRQTNDAHVVALGLKFPKDGEGVLAVELAVPGRPGEDGEAGDLVWELWLEGRPFAAGVARPELKLPRGQWGRTTLKLPLAFRSASWSPDPREVRVRFTGRLVRKFSVDAPATELDEQRVVVSEGAVAFERGGGMPR